MDDFGGIWERDYGLGRRNRSNSGRTNFDSSRFSDSFSRGKLKQQETLNKGRNYSSPAKYSSNIGSSTYNMYSEIFSSNMHSTIPCFEDVFRVPRPRTKVSDVRENEIFRGMPSALRKNSRVTYEDIFADDVSSGPFLFSDVAGSRLTVASSRSASSSGTPRRDSTESPIMDLRNGNHHVAALKVQSPQGSFLALSKKAPKENAQDKEPSLTRQELNRDCLTKQEELNMDGLTNQQELDLDGVTKEEELNLHSLPRQEELNSTQQEQDGLAKQDLNSKSLPQEEHGLPKQELNSNLPELNTEGLPKQEPNSEHQDLNDEGLVKQELNSSVNQEGLVKEELNSSLPGTKNQFSSSESPEVETKEWLSVKEVNLTTKPSEIPPPVRLPPSRTASAEIWFETSEADSGPPPTRVPPPVETSVSELLERNLKGRSQHEMSIREKVLDWQKHNLKEELMMESLSGKSSRRETLIKAPKKRAEVERIEAEVEHLMAEQAKARAERAKLAKDARQSNNHRKGSKGSYIEQDITEGEHAKGSEVKEHAHAEVDSVKQKDEKGEKGSDVVSETDGGDTKGLSMEQNGHATVLDVKQDGHTESVDVEGEKVEKGADVDEKGNKGENVVNEVPEQVTESTNNDGDAQGDNLPASNIQAPEEAEAVREEEHPKAETESTISMVTISSEEAVPNGKLKEEAAPETPERMDKVHPRHEGNKSSETEIPEDAMESAWKELDTTKKQEEDREAEARRNEERTLVARITAEVRERAAMEAKARAENASTFAEQRRTKPRLKEQQQESVAKELEDSRESPKNLRKAKLSLREQLEKERLARIENEQVQQQQSETRGKQRKIGIGKGKGELVKVEGETKAGKTETLVEKITSEVRGRAEREKAERERLERLDRARERERERLERLEKERERERKEQEREREIEREKDRVGLEEKAAKERAAAEEAARLKMERAAVERATAEARARAFERAAAAVAASSSNDPSRPTSVPKQRFVNSASMPSNGALPSENAGMRRATSSTNLESDRYSSASSSNNRDFEQEFVQELKGETPERRKARLERFQRTQNRAAQALAEKYQRDLEMQSEQAERQRLSEKLDGEIKRWSVGKDGNIRALLSTLQYVLWPDSGWKQLTLTELITPAAVKKAYRRATLCVHPDKMQQKHASVQQKYIAEKVFHILQVAWNKFNAQEGL